MAAGTALGIAACGGHAADGSRTLPDTLRVATLYSPTSYFIYRDEPMGYDYSMVSDFAKAKGMVLDLHVAHSMKEAVAMLDSGKVDLLACEVPVTSQFKGRVVACGPEMLTTQVLVQPKEKGAASITDVTQLPGRDIYVEQGSRYEQRLKHLNDELGGGINIHLVDSDSLIEEDLIQMVNDGKIPLTIVNRNVARLNATYYPDLDVSLDVSFPQRAAWGAAPDMAWLADSVDSWLATAGAQRDNDDLLKRYFEMSKGRTFERFDFSKGYISNYDRLFKTYAGRIGWDWRLLALEHMCYAHVVAADNEFQPLAVVGHVFLQLPVEVVDELRGHADACLGVVERRHRSAVAACRAWHYLHEASCAHPRTGSGAETAFCPALCGQQPPVPAYAAGIGLEQAVVVGYVA